MTCERASGRLVGVAGVRSAWPIGSTALQLPAVNGAAQQSAACSADDRSYGPVAPAGEFASQQCADRSADDKAGCSVVPSAIIAPIPTAPHTIAARQSARLIISSVAVVEAALLGTFAMGRRPGRRFGKRRCCRRYQATEQNCCNNLLHTSAPNRARRVSGADAAGWASLKLVPDQRKTERASPTILRWSCNGQSADRLPAAECLVPSGRWARRYKLRPHVTVYRKQPGPVRRPLRLRSDIDRRCFECAGGTTIRTISGNFLATVSALNDH